MNSYALSHLITIVVAAVIGTVCQFVFWKDMEQNLTGILTHAPFMWFVYLFISIFVVEHMCRLINLRIIRKHSKPDKTRRNQARKGDCNNKGSGINNKL
jgi:divalent metal cation (Fe/Co/Zn/Cd) transporter